jgi:hypothetical protein
MGVDSVQDSVAFTFSYSNSASGRWMTPQFIQVSQLTVVTFGLAHSAGHCIDGFIPFGNPFQVSQAGI